MINYIGTFCFGLVVGWVTYRTLRRQKNGSSISDIAAVIGAIGGAGVTSLFDKPELFSTYSIGLAVGFFLYFIIGLNIKEANAGSWMLD